MLEQTQKHANELEQEGLALGRIHSQANYRKALTYWLGFLKGILASNKVERTEYEPLVIEAENFLKLLHDPDAFELLEDIRLFRDDPKEIYAIIEDIIAMRTRGFVIESEKDEINDLYGFCAGIACDNSITPSEIENLLQRLDSYPRIQSDQRLINLQEAARRSIADGRITPEESDDICSWIAHVVGDSATDTGIATFGNVGVLEGALQNESDVLFDGRMFVLTGKFNLAPRKAIEGMIADRGGRSKKGVCSNTDYLCVATQASRDWRHSHEGLKIIHAIELRTKGRGPDLVPETILTKALSR